MDTTIKVIIENNKRLKSYYPKNNEEKKNLIDLTKTDLCFNNNCSKINCKFAHSLVERDSYRKAIIDKYTDTIKKWIIN
jgi:hypothetical protein